MFGKSSLKSLDGCAGRPVCEPSFFTMFTTVGTDRNGDPAEVQVTGARVKNRRVAERSLAKLQLELDEKRGKVAPAKSCIFDEWLVLWRERVDDGHRSQETIDQSARTGRLAAQSFGNVDVRDISDDEIDAFVRACRRRGNNPHTVDKHLRHLHGIFQLAIGAKRLDRNANPVAIWRETNMLELEPSQPNYFTDGELAALWAQFEIGIPEKDGHIRKVPPVYLYLAKFACATGARLGELAALTWANVGDGTVRIEASSHQKYGVGKTKTRSSRRTINLIPDARRVLERWTPILIGMNGPGAIDDDALVFPAAKGGRLKQTYVAVRVMNPIMAAAGVAKTTDETPEERSFHTFRHTYARLMLQPRKDTDGNTVPGESLQWVRDELGHSSVTITERIYGHWSKQAKQDVAAAVPAGLMPV
jgi:integrase